MCLQNFIYNSNTETLNVKKETACLCIVYYRNNLVFVNGMKNDDKCPQNDFDKSPK